MTFLKRKLNCKCYEKAVAKITKFNNKADTAFFHKHDWRRLFLPLCSSLYDPTHGNPHN